MAISQVFAGVNVPVACFKCFCLGNDTSQKSLENHSIKASSNHDDTNTYRDSSLSCVFSRCDVGVLDGVHDSVHEILSRLDQ